MLLIVSGWNSSLSVRQSFQYKIITIRSTTATGTATPTIIQRLLFCDSEVESFSFSTAVKSKGRQEYYVVRYFKLRTVQGYVFLGSSQVLGSVFIRSQLHVTGNVTPFISEHMPCSGSMGQVNSFPGLSSKDLCLKYWWKYTSATSFCNPKLRLNSEMGPEKQLISNTRQAGFSNIIDCFLL